MLFLGLKIMLVAFCYVFFVLLPQLSLLLCKLLLSEYYRVHIKKHKQLEQRRNGIVLKVILNFPWSSVLLCLLYQGYVTLCSSVIFNRKLCTLNNSGISSTQHLQSSLTNCHPANLMSHLCQGQGWRVGDLCCQEFFCIFSLVNR